MSMTKEKIQNFLDASPFISFLRLEVTQIDLEQQRIAVHVPMRPEFERGRGTKLWHGGVIAAVIDTVGDYALVLTTERPLPTVNFRVDYLRPAVDTSLTAVATVRRAGKSVGVVDIDVFDDHLEVVAIGRATYSMNPIPARASPDAPA